MVKRIALSTGQRFILAVDSVIRPYNNWGLVFKSSKRKMTDRNPFRNHNPAAQYSLPFPSPLPRPYYRLHDLNPTCLSMFMQPISLDWFTRSLSFFFSSLTCVIIAMKEGRSKDNTYVCNPTVLLSTDFAAHGSLFGYRSLWSSSYVPFHGERG